MDRIIVMLFMGIVALIALQKDIIPSQKINGVSLEAPRDSLNNIGLLSIHDDGIDWVAVIPFSFAQNGDPALAFNHEKQWWGEKIDGVRQTIREAHAAGLKVMVKPHVWVRGEGWPGEFTLESDSLWSLWEDAYSNYILAYAQAAELEKAELFCIGTEFRISARERPDYWRSLAKRVRQVFSGKLTYAANWDNYENINFWDELDFIGIDAYFPLSEEKHPKISDLTTQWNKLKPQLIDFSHHFNRQILFTEFGYRSTEYSADGHWKHKIEELNADTLSQANCYQALFESIWQEKQIAGGFLWKWHLSIPRRTGFMEKAYSPQGKPAYDVIRKHYQNN